MLDRTKYRKLQFIRLLNGTKAKDYNSHRDLYNYLVQNRYIKSANVRGYRGYKITEHGKAALYEYRRDKFRFFLTAVLTIAGVVATLLSIILKAE